MSDARDASALSMIESTKRTIGASLADDTSGRSRRDSATERSSSPSSCNAETMRERASNCWLRTRCRSLAITNTGTTRRPVIWCKRSIADTSSGSTIATSTVSAVARSGSACNDRAMGSVINPMAAESRGYSVRLTKRTPRPRARSSPTSWGETNPRSTNTWPRNDLLCPCNSSAWRTCSSATKPRATKRSPRRVAPDGAVGREGIPGFMAGGAIPNRERARGDRRTATRSTRPVYRIRGQTSGNRQIIGVPLLCLGHPETRATG
jgi:hypothetical protein